MIEKPEVEEKPKTQEEWQERERIWKIRILAALGWAAAATGVTVKLGGDVEEVEDEKLKAELRQFAAEGKANQLGHGFEQVKIEKGAIEEQFKKFKDAAKELGLDDNIQDELDRDQLEIFLAMKAQRPHELHYFENSDVKKEHGAWFFNRLAELNMFPQDAELRDILLDDAVTYFEKKYFVDVSPRLIDMLMHAEKIRIGENGNYVRKGKQE